MMTRIRFTIDKLVLVILFLGVSSAALPEASNARR
jgi:hypothetical protein